ncbi:MAG: ABC transporter permease [Actinomycetota bacterium]|nr:ABC transporter permease [Actinomycetota bacterium]
MSQSHQRRLPVWALRTNGGAVLLFLYAPIIFFVIFSLSASRIPGQWGGFTTEWYSTLFDDSRLQRTIWVSVRVALVSTLIATVLGTMAALALERFTFRGRRVFDALLYLPIIIPDVTMAVMMLMFFSQSFNVVDAVFGLGLSKGFGTIVVSHVAFNIAFVSVVVRARIAGMNATLEQAASDLYASRWQAFRYVTLPLIAPGVFGGALLALTLSLDDVVVTQFVAGPGSTTLPVYVFSLIRKGVTPTINSVSVIMLVASLILVAGSVALQRANASRGRQQLQTSGGTS